MCAALLGLIQIGSSTAFNDVLSLVLEGFYASYLCALTPLLYLRLRGRIAEPEEKDNIDVFGTHDGYLFTWGPWRLKGWLGTANNALACIYLMVIGFFGFWPPERAVRAENMNYACLVLGSVAIGSALYYFGWAKRIYSGPIVEVKAERY